MPAATPDPRVWRLLAAALCLFVMLPIQSMAEPAPPADATAGEIIEMILDPETGRRIIPNERCLKCHGDENERTDVRDDGSVVEIYVSPHQIDSSVHGDQLCTDCHATIRRVPHREPPELIVGCIECHRKTLAERPDSADPDDPKYERLAVTIDQTDRFMNSIHAQPSLLDQSRTNAGCYDCHDGHNIGALGSIQRAEYRLDNPNVCGRCHAEQLEDYRASVHGRAVLDEKDSESAVCSDCHTTHDIDSPRRDPVMLAITENCGSCHQEALKTYRSSYHGQVNRLGYTHTAKCYDCHGSHELLGEDDPASSIHRNNRLKTCQTCHEDAPEHFIAFHAHGDASNAEKYPAMWITKRFMQVLIALVLLFFWTHVLLWMHREYKDRKAGKSYAHPLPGQDTVYVRRFSLTWRWIHLLFAVSTMTLMLTGTALLFAHSAWSHTFIALIGGPQVEAIVHRTAGVIWLIVFNLHIIIALVTVARRKDFRWFGPESLMPNWQDLRDVAAMFRWFLGRAERPQFDRFPYWQKFDYWAPFWGAAAIGFTGVLMFMPTQTTQLLPGWVLNVAMVMHAEEALLATAFLFTVHFFNAHFRPDRFPMSTIIFTGAVPLEEFKFEHRLEYERLKASGELDKYLVGPPSPRMARGAWLLTSGLILFGLALLTTVILGSITLPH